MGNRKGSCWGQFEKNDTEIANLYLQGAGQKELAELFQVDKKTICRSLRRTNTSTIGRKGLQGEKNPAWKGGKVIDGGRYILIHQPNHPHANSGGYIREHRLVIEKVLGRYLSRKEVVHHKNGNRMDNRLENLILFSCNGIHLGIELLGKTPKWTSEGIQKILCPKKYPLRKGIPQVHSPKGTGARQLRKKLIQEFLHETSRLQNTELVAVLPQLPILPKRRKKK